MLVAASNSGLFDGVHKFFHSGTWYAVRDGLLLLVGVFYIATIFWVNKDARRRIDDPWLVATATLLGVVPFVGPLVYMLFRPPEYLDDVRERELEIKAMEERLQGYDLQCPVCRADVESTFLVCPVCTTKLKQACASCKAPLEPVWQVCPYCETPIVRPSPVVDVNELGLGTTIEAPRQRRSSTS
jgi:hypothetical protein